MKKNKSTDEKNKDGDNAAKKILVPLPYPWLRLTSEVNHFQRQGQLNSDITSNRVNLFLETTGILSYHQNWQNGIVALIQKPYAENKNAFDRSMEITRLTADDLKGLPEDTQKHLLYKAQKIGE